MNKNSFIFFLIICAVLGFFYIFMQYQVKTAEDLIEQTIVTVPPTAAVKKETVAATRVAEKPVQQVPEFIDPPQVADEFLSEPEKHEILIGD
jgi:hypothetical protein